MRQFRVRKFDEIKGFQLGWSLAGPPLMSTHCFLLGDLMVDTGQAHMQREVLEVAVAHGVKQVVLTHHHEDHTGNAAAVKQACSATVYGHDLTIAKMARRFNIFPYQKYIWGKSTPLAIDPFPGTLDTCSGPLTAFHTPGHAKDHLVYLLPDRGILFSGDLYLGDRIKYFRADEDMGAQIASLKKVLTLDFDMLLCCHRPRSRKGKIHIQRKLMFLEELYGNIIHLHKKGLPARQILPALNLKEDYFIKYFCFGNVSMINGIRSALRHHLNA